MGFRGVGSGGVPSREKWQWVHASYEEGLLLLMSAAELPTGAFSLYPTPPLPLSRYVSLSPSLSLSLYLSLSIARSLSLSLSLALALSLGGDASYEEGLLLLMSAAELPTGETLNKKTRNPPWMGSKPVLIWCGVRGMGCGLWSVGNGGKGSVGCGVWGLGVRGGAVRREMAVGAREL